MSKQVTLVPNSREVEEGQRQTAELWYFLNCLEAEARLSHKARNDKEGLERVAKIYNPARNIIRWLNEFFKRMDDRNAGFSNRLLDRLLPDTLEERGRFLIEMARQIRELQAEDDPTEPLKIVR